MPSASFARSVIAALVLLLAASAPGAFGMRTSVSAAQDEVTLLVWDHFTDSPTVDVVDQIYDGFEAAHPNITIEREVFLADEIEATARTALASGTGPDLVYMDVSPARELIAAGLMQPLDAYAEEYGWRDRFYPSGLSWTTIDDQLWGLGAESEFVGIFYNQTLIDQEGLTVPQTLDEALEFCRAASELGYVPIAHSQNPGWQAYFTFTMPVHNNVGVEEMEALLFDGEGRWDSPEIARAVESVYVDMKEAGCFIDDLNGLDFDGAVDLFNSGEALMLPTGTWVVDRIVEFSKTNDIQMMPWFAIEEGQERVYTQGMGSAYFLSAASEHPDEAALFLDYLFSPEAVQLWVGGASRIPPVPVDTTTPELSDLAPLQKYVIDTLEAAEAGEGSLGWNIDLLAPEEFNVMQESGFQAVWAGTKTIEEQLADLQEIWETERTEGA